MVWPLQWCCLWCLRIHDVAQAGVVTEVLLVWKLLPKGHPYLSQSALVSKDVSWTWLVLVWVVDVGVALLAQICAKAV